ncbi:hypothetical protein PsorP6_003901 [Peronosclerospora sorghi]|uniref:Uncharacterized protein n=1 Tax=Peronosclerospora sorghi TaxID=230839 RepID=A0ACC0VL51_9STRA|nr:hypothetical protein PsorP6_003901 [Peronosclerospora sorghi]
MVIESALASLQQDKNRIISETLLKDNGDMLKSTTEVRALTLSDNKRIARLQAALKLIVDAYEAQHDKESDGECNVNQNVLQTVAGAVMMQSLSDCSASKTSGCFWGPQGTKMQFLLDWMINYENDRASSTRDYIRQLLLEWIQPAAEKKHQLAACLALLEFLQRHRCKFEISSRSSTISCLVGDRTEIFMNALQAVVDRGTIRVANSPCVKLSKLALIALEALVLLSGDIAAKYLTSDEAAKKELAQGDLMRLTVESINFVLHVLRRWHSHSMHRRFLVAAVEHLQSYASPCKIILKNGVGHESPSNICLNVTTALNVLSWHWVASVPVFCTRIDVFIRVQKISLSENFSRVLKKVIYEATMDGSYDTNTPAEVMYAQLRYVCLVMDSVGREKGCYKVLEESSQEIKTAFVVVFTHSLSLASRNGAEGTIRLILRVFRTVFLTGERLQLLSSQDEEQELLSQLLRIHDSAVEAKGNSDGLSQCLDELEFFLADYVISRDLFITEILRRLQDAYTQCDLVSRVLKLNLAASTCRCAKG